MKKYIVKMIRSMIYFYLRFFKFKGKKYHFRQLNAIKRKYESKELKLVDNNTNIVGNTDLTIIVPAYNAEKYIEKCINSIINQETRYKYNVILINDGSSDGTLGILKSYEEKYSFIKVFSQKNIGIAETRNKGIKHISGKYVAFIDSDDFIEKNYVEKLLNCAYEKDADIVRCNYYEYDINKKSIIKTGKNRPNKTYVNGLGRDITDYKGYPWGGIFKSKLWRRIEFPNGYWYEDMIIRMICFREAKVFSYINDKLYYYCIHDNNISKSIEKTKNIKSLDQLFLTIELSNLSRKLDLKNDDELYYCLLYEFSTLLWLRTRKINNKLRREVFQYACDFMQTMNDNYTLNEDFKIASNIFNRQDYTGWKLYAVYKMIGVKYGIE